MNWRTVRVKTRWLSLLRLVGEKESVPITERFSLDTARLRAVILKVADAAGWRQPLAWVTTGFATAAALRPVTTRVHGWPR